MCVYQNLILENKTKACIVIFILFYFMEIVINLNSYGGK